MHGARGGDPDPARASPPSAAEPELTLGPAALVGARKAAGLTQEQLAERAGISPRALRNLETGRARSPRGSTLELLARGLGLQGPAATGFLDSWSASRRLANFDDLNVPGYEIEILRELERSVSTAYRDVFMSRHTVLGPDRRLVSDVNSGVFEAVESGVRRRIMAWVDQEGLDHRGIQLTDFVGCRLAGRVAIADKQVTAFEFEFSRTVAQGERHQFGFRMEWDPAYGPGPALDKARMGFRTHVDMFSSAVLFAADDAPARAWLLSQPVGREESLTPTRRSDDGSLGHVFRDLAPGSYGHAWRW